MRRPGGGCGPPPPPRPPKPASQVCSLGVRPQPAEPQGSWPIVLLPVCRCPLPPGVVRRPEGRPRGAALVVLPRAADGRLPGGARRGPHAGVRPAPPHPTPATTPRQRDAFLGEGLVPGGLCGYGRATCAFRGFPSLPCVGSSLHCSRPVPPRRGAAVGACLAQVRYGTLRTAPDFVIVGLEALTGLGIVWGCLGRPSPPPCPLLPHKGCCV